ncbi:tumor necrosis factor b (TNF superfamily, member 2) [Polymixia lowei]
MVDYTVTPDDLETGLRERTVVVVEKKSSLHWMWMVCGAILIVALCVTGGRCLTLYFYGGPEATMQPEKTEALIKDRDEATDPHDTLKRIVSKAKAAMHLEGSYEDSKHFKGQVEWSKDAGQAFAEGGFQVNNNQIIIPQNGLYFVYSQASFRVSCNDGDGEGAAKHMAPLSHRIWRYSDSVGSDTSLMSAVRSACQRTPHEDSYRVGEGWYNAIYLGAVFKLNKGDKLWTETNQVAELEYEGGKTFFGVFSL